jgi:hypothetical protein
MSIIRIDTLCPVAVLTTLAAKSTHTRILSLSEGSISDLFMILSTIYGICSEWDILLARDMTYSLIDVYSGTVKHNIVELRKSN